MSADTLELEFLRYFYDVAGQSMGPSDDDIYWMIQQDFKKKFGGLPDGYDVEADVEAEEAEPVCPTCNDGVCQC